MVRKYNQGVADSNRRRTKHGGASTRLYRLWVDIKQRCNNPNTKHYHRYGGRGITVCKEWAEDFACFYQGVGESPAPGMTLDRIDNSRGYEPGNTRWATRKEQANNRSTNVVLTHNGETHTLKEWAKIRGEKYGLLSSRWKSGKRGEELFAPAKWVRDKCVSFNGKSQTLRAWSTETGVPYITLYWRVKHGKSLL